MLLAAGCQEESAPSPTSPAGRVPVTPSPGETRAHTEIVPPGTTSARAVRAVDGDTIIVHIDGREERLRYIGIDTPESVDPDSPVECYGPEASSANSRLVEGRTVYLERDVSDRDQYGRLLRYVYVDVPGAEDPMLVNRLLVASGYARAIAYPPDTRHSDLLSSTEDRARDAEAGLWRACR